MEVILGPNRVAGWILLGMKLDMNLSFSLHLLGTYICFCLVFLFSTFFVDVLLCFYNESFMKRIVFV